MTTVDMKKKTTKKAVKKKVQMNQQGKFTKSDLDQIVMWIIEGWPHYKLIEKCQKVLGKSISSAYISILKKKNIDFIRKAIDKLKEDVLELWIHEKRGQLYSLQDCFERAYNRGDLDTCHKFLKTAIRMTGGFNDRLTIDGPKFEDMAYFIKGVTDVE